jgi:RNA polymerase sigma-70 factor (ECF subfamily)
MSTRDSKFDVAKTQAYEAQLDPEEWVDAHGDYLFRYANSRLQDIQAAEEVVQDTFVAGLRHQAQFSGIGSERSWLLAILKRKLVDQLRKRSKLEESWGGETDPTVFFFDEKGRWRPDKLPHIGPDEQLNTGELWEVVKACLKKLPIGQADVFVLSVMEEMNTEEICKELEISASNLWVRLHRARLSLARCVSLNWFSDDEIREFHD